MSVDEERAYTWAERRLKDLPHQVNSVSRWTQAASLIGVPAVELGSRKWLNHASFVLQEALEAADSLRNELLEVQAMISRFEEDADH